MLIKVQREIDRCRRVMRERVWPRVHRPLASCQVTASRNPGEPVMPASFIADAEAGRVVFSKLEEGQPWGTSWGTTWMKVTGRLPKEAAGLCMEIVFDLGWLDWPVGGHIEGMVYRPDGTAIKAIHPRNQWIPFVGADGRRDRAVGDDGAFTLYVEAAYNPNVPSFTVTQLGKGPTGRADQRYEFHSVDLCEYRQDLHEYWVDLDVVSGALACMDEGDPRYWKLAKGMQRSINAYDGADQETISRTLPEARRLIGSAMDSPANHSALTLSAMGHAHIDSAWLWPVRETKRKVGRTVSNVLTLLDSDPDFIYVMSSAQQYAWLEERNPDLFERVKEYVRQGRFVPVGGMWVESDGMVPSGESLIRQLSYGSRYFKEKFGVETHGVWLPDSFGYTGSWPQIARRSGCRWFLTQKLCWNDTTRMPHHSFMWEGIDGSRIFTHFPPADKYDSDLSAGDLNYAEKNFKDKDLSDHAILLFGYGDGGGGPTREMTMRASRLHSFEGLPRVVYDTPDGFFDRAYEDMAAQAGDEMPVWKGELYLELHRKTLTSQQDMKKGCRQEESWLRTAEYSCALAALVDPDYAYPRQELDRIWKTLLLNQFHDILPGSGIAWIYDVARQEYRRDIASLRDLVAQAAQTVGRALPDRRILEGVRISQCCGEGGESDQAWRPVPVDTVQGEEGPTPATAEGRPDGSVILDNGLVRATVCSDGSISSLYDLVADRELVAPGQGLGRYEVLKDEPGVFDAWDVERDAFLCATPLVSGTLTDVGVTEGGTAQVNALASYRSSRIRTRISLRPGRRQVDFHADVEWKVPEKLLKVAFPLAIQADRAQYETQYGLVERPVIKNTEGDEARFESCTHRFVRIADGGYGVGLVNASTYGSDVNGLFDGNRGAALGTKLRLTLLASPVAPDPDCDLGVHGFDWALVVGGDLPSTLSAAAEINAPVIDSFPDVAPPVTLTDVEGVPVIDWIKLADDGSRDVIVRIYEAAGAEARTRIGVSGPLATAGIRETDLLERDRHYDGEPDALTGEGPAQGAEIRLAPFQITTLRLSLAEDSKLNPRS
ncbi:alpha-mannosidase [Bifidobacterium favimelis]|uniref:Glycoside hydrolase family 38 C-terminal domain-containing protein n=1 Tax=Bifidobacterium favimelis TaxID=3122979 RepID=A0ABU8ZNM5_9BIFI